MANLNIDAKRISQGLTVTLRLRRARQMAIRHFIASQLIRLACWIGWLGFEIQADDYTRELF